MKRNVPCPYYAEAIVWIDNAETRHPGLWQARPKQQDVLPVVVFSVGFVVNETDHMIALARDVSEHNANTPPLYILKKCVLRRRVVPIGAINVKNGDAA